MVFTTMKKATNTHIQHLLNGLALEEKAQQERYNIKDFSGIKQLKREGLALHPIKIGRKSYGFAEYPECSFKVPLSQDTGNFRDGATVEIFFDNEPAIKGTLLGLEGTNGEVRLFAPDYPDWIDENGVGIKLTPDTKTTEIISEVLLEFEKPKLVTSGKIVKLARPDDVGPAFHEKKAKNKKVNVRYDHKKAMMDKYGKPKRRRS
jgi:hypothetical protein